jgi:hypothetical protein
MSEQHIALSAERQSFRSPLGLRPVHEKEEGADIRRLPEGVYGYTTAPASDELPLFAAPIYRSTEVHKLKGGAVQVIGYVTEKEAAEIENGAEPLAVDLYPEPYEKAVKLAAIPLSRIDARKLPTRDHGNSMRVEVAPK